MKKSAKLMVARNKSQYFYRFFHAIEISQKHVQSAQRIQ